MNYWANLFFSRKFILSLLAVLILALVFRIWIYDGYLHVQGVSAPYELDISSYAHYECLEDPCVLAVPPGDYFLRINKDGFFEESEQITIKFQEDFYYSADLQKIPELEMVSDLPAVFQENLTPLSSFSMEDFFTVDNEGNVYLLEKNSGKLIFLSANGGSRDLLAEFEPFSEAELVLGDGYLFILSQGEFYEVDLAKKRKYRLLADEYVYEINYDQGFLFVDVGNDVLVRFKQDDFQVFPFEVFVKQICVFGDKIFFTENNTFYQVDSKYFLDKKKIIQFTVNKALEKVACESENSLFLLLEGEEVYRIKF